VEVGGDGGIEGGGGSGGGSARTRCARFGCRSPSGDSAGAGDGRERASCFVVLSSSIAASCCPPGGSCSTSCVSGFCSAHLASRARGAHPRSAPKARRIWNFLTRSISALWRALRASSCFFCDGDLFLAALPLCCSCCCCSQCRLCCSLPLVNQTTPYSSTFGISKEVASSTTWRTFRRAARLKPIAPLSRLSRAGARRLSGEDSM
jgi:hypothetical protein